ncbi:uncharacterized protein LOC135280566 isoform X2 [Passer domesticus]
MFSPCFISLLPVLSYYHQNILRKVLGVGESPLICENIWLIPPFHTENSFEACLPAVLCSPSGSTFCKSRNAVQPFALVLCPPAPATPSHHSVSQGITQHSLSCSLGEGEESTYTRQRSGLVNNQAVTEHPHPVVPVNTGIKKNQWGNNGMRRRWRMMKMSWEQIPSARCS